MPDYLPKIAVAAPFTLPVSAAVTGGRVLAVSGAGTVAHAAADSALAIGVAGFDAAAGDRVTVIPRGGIHRLTASGAIAAGARVATAAAGKIQTLGANVNAIGTALTAASSADDVIEIVLD